MDQFYDALKYIFKFALSIFTATFVFVIVFAPALYLSVEIDQISALYPEQKIIYYIMVSAKYLMLGLDAVLFVIFLLKEFWVAAKGIIYAKS